MQILPFEYISANYRLFIQEDNGYKELIKVLREDSADYEKALFNLQNEYNLLKDSTVKGIRKAVKIDLFQNQPALYLEYIEGKSIRDFFEIWSLIEKLETAIRLSQILTNLHLLNIIHKDINPNNIIVSSDHEVHIIDFGISSRFSQKQSHLGNPKHLEGTLRYISPEQTGRVNKIVDYRSDLYSLGISLYELFTGKVPFSFTDPMELVHAHIATSVPKLENIDENVSFISQIILKLLQKNAEDRYQSGAGLQHDLEKCLEDYKKNGKISSFELAKKDFSDKFQLPQKLYGREDEIQCLIDSFERVSQEGKKELLLVSGYSGVGKSALINEIHKPITEKRGYFIGGKYDQFQRNIPYYAIRKALSELIGYILAEDSNKVIEWKNTIQQAVGDSGKVLAEIIPELELLIGEQAEVSELQGEQFANRFTYVFTQFIKAICTPQHSIVLFIDDLQWADNASLNLLKVLLTDEQLSNFLLIGAYRDNEVDDSHPFVSILQSIEQTQITPIHQIFLKNLSPQNLEQWLTDAFGGQDAKNLAHLTFQKTQGNAFFSRQFLQNLYEEELLTFDFSTLTWKWSIPKIQSLNITDNVVELMTAKIQKLSSGTQYFMKLGACIGNTFELATLVSISQKSEEEIRIEIEDALVAGLLLQANQYRFSFVHDRIQQASYGLIEESERKKLHYQIGKLWLSNASESDLEDKLIDIVAQLNFAVDLFENEQEKDFLRTLNWKAGVKAKNSIAYNVAHNYFQTTDSLLPSNKWVSHYDFSYQLYKNWGEVAFLINEKELSATLLQTALDNAHTKQEKAEIHYIKIPQYSSMSQYFEASNECIKGLNLFGWDLPPAEDVENYATISKTEIELYMQLSQDKTDEDILALPLLGINSDYDFCTKLLNIATDAIFLGPVHLFPYLVTRCMNISLQQGLSEHCTYLAGCLYLLFASMKQYQTAYQKTQLALKLQSKLNNKSLEAKVYHTTSYSTLIAQPFEVAAAFQDKCNQVGFENGDFVFAGYGLLVKPRYFVPLDLEKVIQNVQKGDAWYKRSNNIPLIMLNHIALSFALAMKGQTAGRFDFSHEGFDQKIFEDIFMKASPTWVGVFRRYQIHNAVLWGDFEMAMQFVEERNQWMALLGGLDQEFKTAYYLFSGITVASLFRQNKLEKEKAFSILEECIEEIKLLQDVYEGNFAHAYHILLAQKAQNEQNILAIMNHYDQAIDLSIKYGFRAYAALAAELAGEFYLSIQKQRFAGDYLQQAINYYKIWGASVKANELENKYGGLLKMSQIPIKDSTVSLNSNSFTNSSNFSVRTGVSHHKSLDMSTVLKASQTLSREIQLSSLLQKMMQILIENAGADKGILILEKNKEWFIEAESYANSQEIKVLHALPLAQAKHLLSSKVVNYVSHSKKTLVLHNAAKESNLIEAQYVKDHHIKSVLSLPILNQGKLIGILYLENSLVEGAFSTDRVELLSTLVSQVAISIENALLYENLEQKVQERTKQLKDALGDIHASINYAKRIQTAILPVSQKISEVLPEHFIYFQPKDVVSGDFYWFTHKKDDLMNLTILTAIDCTGHGVPGAFMSMIGDATLNQIIHDQEIHRPDLILNEMHKRIQNTLNQNEASVRDGMDMALISIDHQQNILSFAGAMNPFYYVKNGEFVEIKADKFAIGGASGKQERIFTLHNILLDSEITFYLCSDGYQDQFGGADIRKFMVKRFRELLFSVYHLPMKEQKQILSDTMYDWKRQDTLSQTDDILVIGAIIS